MQRRNNRRPQMPEHTAEVVAGNIEQIIRVEQRDHLAMTWVDRIADRVTQFMGSMLFVGIHMVLFAAWIILNLGWVGFQPFDPFPFGLLAVIAAIEAIFLSTFVLISQNRQAMMADRRAKVALQIAMISEQESTKLIDMVATIQEFLGIQPSDDPDLETMRNRTNVEHVADAIDEAEKQGEQAPSSAIDTES